MSFPSKQSIQNQFRFFLGFAIVVLAIAYVPYGWMAVGVGASAGWGMAIGHRNLWEMILGVWWVVATILGNLQILFCLASPFRENRFLQNPVLKGAALVGQLSWVPCGAMFYPWYFWILGSLVLFTITPRCRIFPHGNHDARQDWARSRILSKLAAIPNRGDRNGAGEAGDHEA